MATAPRILNMLNAKERLPERLRTLFELLFLKGMTESQASEYLQLDIDAIHAEKNIMMRTLKAAAS